MPVTEIAPDLPGEVYGAMTVMPLHPHNAVLQVWLELGAPGALALAGGPHRRCKADAVAVAVTETSHEPFSESDAVGHRTNNGGRRVARGNKEDRRPVVVLVFKGSGTGGPDLY